MPTRPCTCPTSARPSGRFNLVTQVAGRTGRGERRPGAGADVQSRSSGHPRGGAARLRGVCREELPIRQMLRYPPFAAMIRLVVPAEFRWSKPKRWRKPSAIGCVHRWVTSRQRPVCSAQRRAGPFAKLRGHYRYHLQLQGPDGEALCALVRKATERSETMENLLWAADVDPLEML